MLFFENYFTVPATKRDFPANRDPLANSNAINKTGLEVQSEPAWAWGGDAAVVNDMATAAIVSHNGHSVTNTMQSTQQHSSTTVLLTTDLGSKHNMWWCPGIDLAP